MFAPILSKQSFLLEFAQVRRRLRSVRGSLPIFGDAGIFSPKQHPPIGAVRILDFSPHFHLHFMNQVLRVPNLILDIPRGAKQRAKLAGPPANEREAYPAVQTDASKVALAPTVPSCRVHSPAALARSGACSIQTISSRSLPGTVTARPRLTRSAKRARIITELTPAMPVNNRWPSSSPAQTGIQCARVT